MTYMIGFLYEYCWTVNDRTNTIKHFERWFQKNLEHRSWYIPNPNFVHQLQTDTKYARQIYPRLYIYLSGLNSLAVSIYQFYWPNNTQPRPHSSKLGAKLDSAAAEIANKIMVYVGPQGWTSILARPLEPVRRKGRIPLLMQSYKNVNVLYYVVNYYSN